MSTPPTVCFCMGSPWLVAVLVVAALSRPTTQAADSGTAEFLRLEAVWNEAHLHSDAEALDRLWAADLLVIVPKMAPITKPAALAFLRSGRFTFERYATSDTSARIYGDVAVVTGRLERRRQVDDRRLEDDWRFTKVYVRQEGRWRVVLFHASDAGE